MGEREGTVLITGAGRRIGRALALDFGRRGWAVAVHYRQSETEAQAVVEKIRETGGRAAAVQADLSDFSQVSQLISHAQARLGPVTCLINNASRFERDTAADMTEAGWDAHMTINLKAPVFLARDFAAALPEGVEGNVINILDQKVWRLTPHYFSYTIAKAALWTATRTLAQALAPRIRVNAIGPGPTLPNAAQSAAAFARQCAATPLGRGTSPEEIARAVRFILDAPAMTGQMIALDGGRHLTWPQSADPANED